MSTASSTPAGGWYADPLDASLLRWWDGTTWGPQTMPADAASIPSAEVKPTLTAVPPLPTAVPRGDEPYVPPNSVFRMAESAAGDAYVPEWSGLTDISEEVARSGVPVQLALTSTSGEPPIPVSADVFPTLRVEADDTPEVKTPAWKVEAPLAAPVDQLFPVESTPTAFPAAPAAPLVPQPAGDAFPGLVPSAPPPTMYADPPMPPEPAAPMAVAPTAVAPVAVAPVAMPPQPMAPQLAPPQPIAPQLAPPQPTPVVYAGPPAIAAAPEPVAPPDFMPFAASTPGATYVPLAPRPIPQPLNLGAPSAAPSAPPAAPPTPGMPSAPSEQWPTQGAPAVPRYQPDPGDYVPFDPNSVHLEPMPVIPFSSRDPFNSASTARPGMRAYAAAPVGPSGSTWTGGLAFMLLAPLITTATVFVWTQFTTVTAVARQSASLESLTWLPYALAAISLLGLASAQIDRSALARRGYFDLASPFWVLLIPPLVYLIVRALRLRGQGKGAGAAIGLWVLSYIVGYVLMGAVAFGWLAAPTPDRVATLQSSIQHEFAARHITASVTCPSVPSLVPGTTFTCTVATQGASQPISVTIDDWKGDFSLANVTSPGS